MTNQLEKIILEEERKNIDLFIEKEREFYYQFVKGEREFRKDLLLSEIESNFIGELKGVLQWCNGSECFSIQQLEENVNNEHKEAIEGNYGSVSIEYLIAMKYMLSIYENRREF